MLPFFVAEFDNIFFGGLVSPPTLERRWSDVKKFRWV
jgi:hypothetical protein